MDVVVKGVPESISEKQVLEWCAILIERAENQKVNSIPEVISATEAAKISIDTFRKTNLLPPKFEVKES